MFLNSRIDLLNDEIHVQGSLIINIIQNLCICMQLLAQSKEKFIMLLKVI